MPLYDYQCRACSKVTEVRHGFRETFDAACEACGGQLARVFNPAGIVFKGSGFYVTDSRKPAGDASSSSSSTTPSNGSAPSATPPAPSTDAGSSKKSESSAA